MRTTTTPSRTSRLLLKARPYPTSLSTFSFPGERGGTSSYLNHNSLSDIGVNGGEASYFISPEDILGTENPNILYEIFSLRNLYYHPAKGLMGRKVDLVINASKLLLIQLCENVVTYNKKRLSI